MLDVKVGLLYDFYGQLLTTKQQDVMHMYFENDYSFSEIALEMEVSRQAVYDMVKKTKKTLYEYEDRLGLVKKFLQTKQGLEKVSEMINELRINLEHEPEAMEKLDEIKLVIAKIEQIEVK